MSLNMNERAFLKLIEENNLSQCSFLGEFSESVLKQLDECDKKKLTDEEYDSIKDAILQEEAYFFMPIEDESYMSYKLYRKEGTKLGVVIVTCNSTDLAKVSKLIYGAYRSVQLGLFTKIDKYYIYALDGKALRVVLHSIK